MSKYFPSELITNILSCLPVKSLLRFKSVSKPWRSLIEEQYFIKSYLKRSTQTNTNLGLIVSKYGRLCWVALDSLDHAIELNYPLYHPNYDCKTLIGSCNGWVCFVNLKQDIVIWNMSTKEYHIAVVPDTVDKRTISTYGFGYDSINDDYKVLRIQLCFRHQTMVHSLKRNSWRKTKDLPYHNIRSPKESGELVGRALHWLVQPSHGTSLIIFAFDVTTEEYNEVPMLEVEGMRFEHGLTVLGVLGGCLCVMTYNYQVGVGNCVKSVDIWVMKDYMVKESWNKLISVPHNTLYLWPLAYSQSGYKLLLIDFVGNLLWHDITEKQIEEIKIPGLEYNSINGICLGSLFPPSADRGVVGKKRRARDKNKMIKNS